MALTIGQIAAASFPKVLADNKKGYDQWSDNSGLQELEKQGGIHKEALGENIEVALDYRSNPDTAVMASDQDESTLLNTEMLTAAVYDIAQARTGVVWTMAEEVKNASEAQKVNLVKQKLENAITSHDNLFESMIFTTSTAGGVEWNGLDTLIPTSGQGSPGGVPATTEAFWRNYADIYTDASDIEAALQTAWSEVLRGSNSTFAPSILLSGNTPWNLFASNVQGKQMVMMDTNDAKAGIKTIAFNNARWTFSQYGGNNIYMFNPKNTYLTVSKNAFRKQLPTQPVPGQTAWYFFIYSAGQFLTTNKSRTAVLSLG